MSIVIDGKLYCKVTGPLLLVLCLFLGILNLPVFWGHLKKKSSPEKHLFVLLSISNLLITWPLGIIEAVNMIKLGFRRSNTGGNIYSNRGKSAVAVILATIGCSSQIFAGFLAITRAIKIANPFKVIKKRILLTAVAMVNTFVVANFMIILYHFMTNLHYDEPDSGSQSPEETGLGEVAFSDTPPTDLHDNILLPVTMGYCCTFLLTVAGNVFSCLSIIYLYRYTRQKLAHSRSSSFSGGGTPGARYAENRRCVITLFLMNIPYVFQLVVSAFYLNRLRSYKKYFDILRELSYIVGPILTSCFNPLILLYRNREYRDLVFATGKYYFRSVWKNSNSSAMEIKRLQNNTTAPTSVAN